MIWIEAIGEVDRVQPIGKLVIDSDETTILLINNAIGARSIGYSR